MTPGSDVGSALDGRPALLQDASRRALRYLAGLADRPVAPSADAVSALRELRWVTELGARSFHDRGGHARAKVPPDVLLPQKAGQIRCIYPPKPGGQLNCFL